MLKRILTILRITQRILGMALDIVSTAVSAVRHVVDHKQPANIAA